MERALQLWLHEKHPDVALHLGHKVQGFKGSQQLAAVGATVIYAGAKGLRTCRRPPPARPKVRHAGMWRAPCWPAANLATPCETNYQLVSLAWHGTFRCSGS